MSVRLARAGDAAAVTALWNVAIRDTLITFNSVEKSEAEVAGLIAERTEGRAAFQVAELDGSVVGFATYSQFRGGVGYARTQEHSVMLAEAARGRGLGRALMSEIETAARDAGHHSIFAGVSSGNPGGRAFHAALGYAEVGLLPEVGFKWGRWLDLILMQKMLATVTA